MNINIDENNIKEEKRFNFKKLLIYIFVVLLVIALTIVYARFKSTSGIKVNEYKVTNNIVTDSFHGLKVVHFSDIHFGNTVDIEYLGEIVDEINKLDGDLVVFTGDLLDKEISVEEKNNIISVLSGVEANIGKYAISGESDYDAVLFNEIITRSGFTNINNSYQLIYNKDTTPIVISNKDELFDSNLYSILLLHEPDKFDSLNNHFNLVLAGHSHNGQLNLPLIKNSLLPNGSKKYINGYYNVNNSDIYVSNGIGTDDFKFRFFNKPSINLYRITKY